MTAQPVVNTVVPQLLDRTIQGIPSPHSLVSPSVAVSPVDPNKIVGDMLAAHAMTNLSPGTLTNPKINKLADKNGNANIATDARAVTADRTAAIVQHKLGLTEVPAFDVNAVCCGFIYALAVAEAMLSARLPGQRGLVIAIGVRQLPRYHADVGDFGHPPHEEERGEDHADLDCHRQVDDYRQRERRQQHHDITLGCGQLAAKSPPLAHVVGHHHQDGGESRERD